MARSQNLARSSKSAWLVPVVSVCDSLLGEIAQKSFLGVTSVPLEQLVKFRVFYFFFKTPKRSCTPASLRCLQLPARFIRGAILCCQFVSAGIGQATPPRIEHGTARVVIRSACHKVL